jgi:3-oxoacyl-[acyl-carrier protein] reductase
MRFKDKVVAITGGATGIGKSIAKRVASEGGLPVLLDRDEKMLAQTAGEFQREKLKAETHTMDIADAASVRAGFDWIGKQFGRLDATVNCAGITGPTAIKTGGYPLDGFDKVYEVNLRGSFLVAQSSLQLMLKPNRGRILLIASIAGKEGNAGMCAYSATKAGVIGLVKSMGKEYAETGITINGLAPAVIHTAMVEALPPQQVKYMTDKIPMKRCGTLDEVAALSAWIISDECSFTTGFIFDLSGGRATY